MSTLLKLKILFFIEFVVLCWQSFSIVIIKDLMPFGFFMPFYIGGICSIIVTIIVTTHTFNAIVNIQDKNKNNF